MEQRYIPLEDIRVSGAYSGNFYPVWVDSFGQPAINTEYDLSLTGWWLVGGTGVGPIICNYVDEDYPEAERATFLARKAYVDAQVAEVSGLISSFLPLSGGILETPVFLETGAVPGSNDEAVSYQYVMDISNQFLKRNVADQRVTGPILLHSASPTDYESTDAVPLTVVNQLIAAEVASLGNITDGFIQLSGDTLTGHLSLYEPVEDCEIATLGYLKKYLAVKTAEYFNRSSSDTST